jgi:serine phosphatase RsbU (regulator of sigma subunit)
MHEFAIRAADGTTTRFPLSKEKVTIGRSRESDIFLPDQWLSRHHAEVRSRDGGHFLVDMGSKNGTLLNGGRIQGEQRLREGDVITLGEHVLTFFAAGGAAEPVADEPEPLGTRVYSVRELSDIKTKPGVDRDELERQNRILGVLKDATAALIEHRPLPELFEKMMDLLMGAVPAERGAIMMLEGAETVVKASRSRDGGAVAKVSRSIVRRVVQDRVAVLLPNLLEDAAFKAQESIVSTGIRSAVCAPLWFASATGGPLEVIGLVYLDSVKGTHTFTEEDLKIITALGNVAAAKIENAKLLEESLEKRRLEQDMAVAAEIQRSLLPKEAPRVPGYGLVGTNTPCRTVGGDYYDFALEEGQLLLALGDVSGKGTGAALLMTVLRASVRGHWTDASPAEAVARINRTVCQNVPDGKYITFFMARLNPESGRITYVNGGHNPPLLVRADGKVELLNEGGMVLGLMESVPYADGSVVLHRGDTLLIFSDGVTETWNREGEEFGEQGLLNLAGANRDLSAADLQDEILRALDRHAAGGKATDDRTLIVLKRDAA